MFASIRSGFPLLDWFPFLGGVCTDLGRTWRVYAGLSFDSDCLLIFLFLPVFFGENVAS
jgi:hypothetical protein